MQLVIIGTYSQINHMGGGCSVNNINKVFKKNYIPLIGKKYNVNHKEDITDELLKTLNEIETGIVITVGSLRDIAALYEANPQIVCEKIEKIFVFAGDFEETYDEYNVEMDKEAYNIIMSSDLPIYWIPCFQNGLWTSGEHCSYFQVMHEEVLNNCDDELLKWFIYEYYDNCNSFDDFELSDEKEEFLKLQRNLWCAPILPFITGQYDERDMLQQYEEFSGNQMEFPWYFTEYNYHGYPLKLFTIRDYDDYIKFNKWILDRIYSKQE